MEEKGIFDFDLRQKAEIVLLAQEAAISLDSRPLTDWFREKAVEYMAEYVSSTPELAKAFLESEGVDLQAVVDRGMDIVQKFKDQYNQKQF